MNRQSRLFLMTGAISSLLAVVLGAFGSHGLEDRLSADRIAAASGTSVVFVEPDVASPPPPTDSANYPASLIAVAPKDHDVLAIYRGRCCARAIATTASRSRAFFAERFTIPDSVRWAGRIANLRCRCISATASTRTRFVVAAGQTDDYARGECDDDLARRPGLRFNSQRILSLW